MSKPTTPDSKAAVSREAVKHPGSDSYGTGDLPRNPHEIARMMLPSLGYFGGIEANFLDVPLRLRARSIYIQLTDPRPTYLHLRGVQLRRDGRPVLVGAQLDRAQISSVREQDRHKDPAALFELGGIHTDLEKYPSWQASFTEPISIDHIRIYNRRDGIGRRSFSLQVTVVDDRGRAQVVHKTGDGDAFSETLAVVRSLLGRRFPGGIPAAEEAALNWRTAVIGGLAARLRRSRTTFTRKQSNLLFALLPTRGGDQLSDDSLYLLAYLLLHQRLLVPGTRTGIESFSLVLNTRERLEQLESHFPTACDVLELPRHEIGRDGVVEITHSGDGIDPRRGGTAARWADWRWKLAT